MDEDERLAELVSDANFWRVYWYDTKTWDTLRLTDPASYAEHLYKCDIDCILVPVSYTHLTLPTNREV